MYFAIAYILLFLADIGATVYIHIEDGLCVDLYDALNMKGGIPTVAIPICGGTLEAACDVGADAQYGNNPYNCKDCDTVTIYDGFPFSRSLATGKPTCQAVFTFPEDYGDVYYSGGRLYDAFGNQIGDTSCEAEGELEGKFLNPWNSYPNATQPSPTPCPSPALPPAPSVTCYHGANPDACPYQYDPGWCYCNNDAALYPIQPGSDPCGYTVLPTTTTTSPICTATE